MNTTIETKHTPGEWEARAERDGRTTVHYVKIGTGNFYGVRGVGQTEQEIQANARLIAAAPELLAALELVYANAGESPEWIRAHIGAAIAKARGQ